MSRRKQGKPQQRKTFDTFSGDESQDMLICGHCHGKFSLSDIVHFIQHKVHQCHIDRTDQRCNDSDSFEDPDDPDNDPAISTDCPPVISYDCPSISAKIHVSRQVSTDCCNSPIVSPTNVHSTAATPCEKTSVPDVPVSDPGKELDLSDHSKPKDGCLNSRPKSKSPLAESNHIPNTSNNEPRRLVCCRCPETFSSAWLMIEHAQKAHSTEIYTTARKAPDNFRPSLSPSKNSESRTSDAGVRKKENPSASSSSLTFPCHNGPTSPYHPPFFFRMPGLSSSLPYYNDRVPPISSINFFRPPVTSSNDCRNGLTLFNSYQHMNYPVLPFQAHSQTSSFPFDRRVPGIGMTQEDFYSHRLRQLAGASPQSRNQMNMSNHNEVVPPFDSNGLNSTTALSPSSPDRRSESPVGSNPKSCEFCGKSFRFQSNLIVHRRTHTGEKPFQCHMCPHACTQASKLKRHMKTHYNKSSTPTSSPSHNHNMSDNSREFDHSSPDSVSNRDLEDELDEDDDELDENDYYDDNDNIKDGSRSSLEKSLEARKIDDSFTNQADTGLNAKDEDNDKPMPNFDLNPKKKKESMLQEVMENSGLDSIPQYNKAWKLALDEDTDDQNSAVGTSTKQENDSHISETSKLSNCQSPEKHNETDQKKQNETCENTRPLELVKGSPSDVDDCNGNEPLPKYARRDSSEALSSLQEMYRTWYPVPSQPNLLLPLTLHPAHFPRGHSNEFRDQNQYLPCKPTPPSVSDGAFSKSLLSPLSGLGHQQVGPPMNGLVFGRTCLKGRNDQCEYCGKIFKNCSNLTVHRRSHTGEKPYKCELCSYACAQSSKLTRHMRTHGRSGKDVYHCKFCSMPFSVASTLEKHMRKCMENHHHHHSLLKADELNSSSGSLKEENLSVL